DLRPSALAGTWYEGTPQSLSARVDGYLADAKIPELNGQVIGVIAPHAGHKYSGQVAAHAFAALRGLSPDLVVILSPFHNYSAHALITTSHQAYATPLGNIEVDQLALAELIKNLDMPIAPIHNDKEHALEIQLPFLQRVFTNDFKLLPIMLSAQEASLAKKLGAALARTLKKKNAVIVASTDLSHFYDQKTAHIFDHEMLKRFESFHPETIFEADDTGKGFACGRAAVASTLWASQQLGADKVQILKYATSGDITKDYSSVVGYGAAAILKTI
ncbi:MAG: AmmeMemoRadiSam system protein B, partial [Anaerolineales bacterium]|nr:AmmeMemoRadiSam system protein B [Anaerolineales bacterium]